MTQYEYEKLRDEHILLTRKFNVLRAMYINLIKRVRAVADSSELKDL